MTDDTQHQETDSHNGDDPLDEFRTLTRAAFEQAQISGKPNWQEMTSAVLKNRILDLTNREFSESRYNSPSFIHLIRRIPDLIEVVEERPPFIFRIKLPTNAEAMNSSTTDPFKESPVGRIFPPPGRDWRKTRIRDDLWRAAIDYDSGAIYVLDSLSGIARPRVVTDLDLPEIPTVSPDEVASWREEFVSRSASTIKNVSADELQAWSEGSGRLTDLPRAARGRWAEFIKKKVAQRLQEWFESQGLALPEDILIDSATRDLPPSEVIDDVVQTRQLRDLVIRAVRTMTYDELACLPIPAEVIFRMSLRHDSGDV